jgi:hypothetical protein
MHFMAFEDELVDDPQRGMPGAHVVKRCTRAVVYGTRNAASSPPAADRRNVIHGPWVNYTSGTDAGADEDRAKAQAMATYRLIDLMLSAS